MLFVFWLGTQKFRMQGENRRTRSAQNMRNLVKIIDLAIEALIDTGSQITAIRETFYQLFGHLPATRNYATRRLI